MEMKEYKTPEMEIVKLNAPIVLQSGSPVHNDDDPVSGGGEGDPILNPAD